MPRLWVAGGGPELEDDGFIPSLFHARLLGVINPISIWLSFLISSSASSKDSSSIFFVAKYASFDF